MTRSATWLPTMPPNQRHWSRACSQESALPSVTYAGAATQIARLHELAGLGVDQFALYLQHDDKDGTLAAYGTHVIPAVTDREAART